MAIKFSNNASTTLAQTLAADALSLTVLTGSGAEFPTLGAGEYFMATLVSEAGDMEIVKVTARAGDVFTIERAQEGTTAAAFAIGSYVENRLTKGALEELLNVTYADADEIAEGTSAAEAISPKGLADAGILMRRVPNNFVHGAGWSMSGSTLTATSADGTSTTMTVAEGSWLVAFDITEISAGGIKVGSKTKTDTGRFVQLVTGTSIAIEAVGITSAALANVTVHVVPSQYVDYITPVFFDSVGTASTYDVGTDPDQIPTNADIVIPPYKVVKPQTILEAPDVFLRNISEFEIDPTKTIPVHTSATSAFGTMSARSELQASSAAWKLVDGQVGDGTRTWSSGNNPSAGEWIQYVFADPQVLMGLSLQYHNHASWAPYFPTAIKIYTGTTGTADKEVFSTTGLSWSLSELKTFMFNSAEENVNVIRVVFTGYASSANVMMGEFIPVFGTKNPVTIVEDPTQVLATHTSNTSDSGTVSVTSQLNASAGWQSWNAFDKNTTTGHVFATPTGTITYVFNEPKYILGYKFGATPAANWPIGRSAKNWTVRVGTGVTPDTVVDEQANQTWSAMGTTKDFVLASPPNYPVKSISFQVTANIQGSEYTGICEIDFKFGKVVTSGAITGEKQVEYMTGATTPEGHAASASSVYSTYQTWKAFQSGNESLALLGWSANAAVPQWLQRDFPSAKKITQYRLGSKYAYPKSWTLQGSNDGSAWTDVDTRTDANNSTAITPWFVVQNPAAFSKYRLYITAQGGYDSPNYVSVACFEMKEEVVSSTGVVVERDVRMVLADGEGSVEDFTTTQRIVPLEMSTTSDWTRVMGSSMTGTLGGGTLAALTDGSLAEVAYAAANNNITHDAGVAKKLRFKMCVQSNVTTSHTFVVETSADNTTWTSKFNGTIADAITAGWVSTSGEPSSYLDAGTNRYIRWRMTSYAAYQREVWLETQLTAGDPVLAVGQQFILAGPDGATATLTPPVYDPASGKWSDGKKQIMLGWVQIASHGVTGIYQCKKGVTVELTASGTTLPNPFINLPIFAVQGTTICPVVNNQITGVTVNTTPVRVWRID